MVSKLKVTAVALLVGSTLAGISARAQGEESSVSATLDVPVLNAYVWRGQVLNDEAVLQPSLTVGKGGFAINWWGNYNLTDNVTGDELEFSEHDISLSYSMVCPLTGANMTLGVVNYDFPNQSFLTAEGNTSLYADTTEGYLIAAFSDVLLAPTLSVYYDFKEADGFYGSLSVSHAIELNDAASLNLGASIGGSDSDWGTFYYVEEQDANFTDYSVSATIPYALNDSWTITPGVAYVSLIGDAEDAVDNQGLYFEETDYVVASLKAGYAF